MVKNFGFEGTRFEIGFIIKNLNLFFYFFPKNSYCNATPLFIGHFLLKKKRIELLVPLRSPLPRTIYLCTPPVRRPREVECQNHVKLRGKKLIEIDHGRVSRPLIECTGFKGRVEGGGGLFSL